MNIQEKVIKHLELQSGKGGITKVSSGEKETHYWSCLVSKGTEKWRKILPLRKRNGKVCLSYILYLLRLFSFMSMYNTLNNP